MPRSGENGYPNDNAKLGRLFSKPGIPLKPDLQWHSSGTPEAFQWALLFFTEVSTVAFDLGPVTDRH